tara:strand:+ start:845 stop:1624 length:780 start_codon:yes stop_codon:yes gene_type:complete
MVVLVLKQSKNRKTLFISGGSKGLGLIILKKYLNEGYRVICASRTPPRILKHNKNLLLIKCDLNNDSSFKTIDKFLKLKKIKIDTLINNVGKSEWRSIKKIDKEFINEMFQINLFASIMITKIVLKYLKEESSIINISSLASKRGTLNNSIYCATKFALNGFTQSISKELGKKRIRVNAVCPVLIKTPGLIKALKGDESPSNKKYSISNFLNNFKNNQTSLNKLPSSNDVSNLCLFLSSSLSQSITGQCINIDCGILSN